MGLRLARGRCLLHKKLPDPALAEFRAVLAIRSDIVAFHGVVTACLQVQISSSIDMFMLKLACIL